MKLILLKSQDQELRILSVSECTHKKRQFIKRNEWQG